MIVNLLLFTIALQDISGLRVQEPRPPEFTRLTYEDSCGSTRLRIKNFGHARPLGTSPRIFMNNRRVTGQLAGSLEHDLANARAIYRFSTRCPQEGGELQLEVYTVKEEGGILKYQVGRASFVDGKLVFHKPLSLIDEGTFWFS
jgi:hypothetical protein